MACPDLRKITDSYENHLLEKSVDVDLLLATYYVRGEATSWLDMADAQGRPVGRHRRPSQMLEHPGEEHGGAGAAASTSAPRPAHRRPGSKRPKPAGNAEVNGSSDSPTTTTSAHGTTAAGGASGAAAANAIDEDELGDFIVADEQAEDGNGDYDPNDLENVDEVYGANDDDDEGDDEELDDADEEDEDDAEPSCGDEEDDDDGY